MRVACVLVCCAMAAGCSDGGDTADLAMRGPTDASFTANPARRDHGPPLHDIVGIASTGGQLPIGADAASTFLRERFLDAAVDLGGLAIRRDFDWESIEHIQGTFVFDGYDRLLAAADERRLPILGSLLYSALWACGQTSDRFYPPTFPATFAHYVTMVAGRYQGRVIGWELWNEPNAGFRFWKPTVSGDAPAYASLLALTHAAVRAVDASTPLVLGGTVFDDQVIDGAITFLGKAYDADPSFASGFEIVGAHVYSYYPPQTAPEFDSSDDPAIDRKLDLHRDLLAARGASDRPIWVTEYGWPSWSAIDEATQAHFLVRATLLGARGASRMFLYTLRDNTTSELESDRHFGLMHADIDTKNGIDATPKPSYTAMRTLIHLAGERGVTGEDAPVTNMPADAYSVVLRGDGGRTLAAIWTTGSLATIAFTQDGDVYAEDGTALGRASNGASISPAVTYVELD